MDTQWKGCVCIHMFHVDKICILSLEVV